MIKGVKTKKLKAIHDERGWLMEIMRSDWEVYKKFGQVYVTTAHPGVVKAWHMHKKQFDNITSVKGTMKLVLYDDREDSSTNGEVNEFVIGEENTILITVPPRVWHGFSPVGDEMAYFVNVPTELYDYKKPDEYRLPPDTEKIPYEWYLDPNLKHG
jgi:dTDP-4-dehydrorhamnose 3,5-epimerase